MLTIQIEIGTLPVGLVFCAALLYKQIDQAAVFMGG